MNILDPDTRRGLEELGLSPRDVLIATSPGPIETMQAALQTLQERAKRAYRGAALRLHPDRNNDPDAAELFRLVTTVSKEIQSLRVRPRVSNHPVMIIRVGGSTTTKVRIRHRRGSEKSSGND